MPKVNTTTLDWYDFPADLPSGEGIRYLVLSDGGVWPALWKPDFGLFINAMGAIFPQMVERWAYFPLSADVIFPHPDTLAQIAKMADEQRQILRMAADGMSLTPAEINAVPSDKLLPYLASAVQGLKAKLDAAKQEEAVEYDGDHW